MPYKISSFISISVCLPTTFAMTWQINSWEKYYQLFNFIQVDLDRLEGMDFIIYQKFSYP